MESVKRWAESPVSDSDVDNAKYYPEFTNEEQEKEKCFREVIDFFNSLDETKIEREVD